MLEVDSIYICHVDHLCLFGPRFAAVESCGLILDAAPSQKRLKFHTKDLLLIMILALFTVVVHVFVDMASSARFIQCTIITRCFCRYQYNPRKNP